MSERKVIEINTRLGQSTDPRAIRTRKALQESFLAVLETTTFDQVTPQQIAFGADVARASFYLHYPSKEALLHEVARDAITTLYELGLRALDEAGPKAAALVNCRHIEANKPLWAALLNGGARAMILDELVHLAREVSDERAMPGDRLPAELSTVFAGGAMVRIIAWWLRQDRQYSVEFVAELMIQLVFNPIRAASTSPNLKFSFHSRM